MTRIHPYFAAFNRTRIKYFNIVLELPAVREITVEHNEVSISPTQDASGAASFACTSLVETQ